MLIVHCSFAFRLQASDFYEMIVKEGKGRIRCHLIEVSSTRSNCFSTILTEVPSSHDFQSFFYVLRRSAIEDRAISGFSGQKFVPE